MTDREKPAFLEAGEWRGTVEGGDPKAVGFHLSVLYSPWVRWGNVAVEHVRVAKDPARLQVFVNARLGECWEDQAGETVHPEPLMARREDWGHKVSDRVGVLIAGVDQQREPRPRRPMGERCPSHPEGSRNVKSRHRSL